MKDPDELVALVILWLIATGNVELQKMIVFMAGGITCPRRWPDATG